MLFTKTVLKPHHSVTLKLICDMWQKLLTQSKHTGISCMGQRLVLHIIILLHLSVLGLREHLVAPLILCRSICRPREVQQLCLAVKGRGGDSSFFFNHNCFLQFAGPDILRKRKKWSDIYELLKR